MPQLRYHAGQLAIQTEASTLLVAKQLAHWVGPVEEFAKGADLVLLAAASAHSILNFTALSGKPPLMEALKGENGLSLRLPNGLPELSPSQCFYGGLVISLANARRARINGELVRRGNRLELEATESFTLCKKYIAPSIALDEHAHFGPVGRQPIALSTPWLKNLLAKAETAFFASLSPDEKPDVAHRGGPPGFIHLDAATHSLVWNEFVGDGVFKSAGNLRATSIMTLLVPDFATGDAAELSGHGEYKNLRADPKQRQDPLVQHHEDYPVQGMITCKIDRVMRLQSLLQPRQQLEQALRITSRSTPSQQAPQ